MTQSIETTELVAGTWNIDPAHSEVGFSVRHLMSKVKGRFADFSGTVTTTSTNAVDASVEVTIVSSSISTNNEQRDAHLQSADFFDPSNGGTLAFRSTRIREGDDGYVISGELTINGITKPVDLAAEFLGVAVDAFGVTRLGAEAHTSIDRTDFNVTFNIPLDGGKLLIGDKVDISLAIEAAKA